MPATERRCRDKEKRLLCCQEQEDDDDDAVKGHQGRVYRVACETDRWPKGGKKFNQTK